MRPLQPDFDSFRHRFSGAVIAEPDLTARYEEFIRQINSADFQLTGKHVGRLARPKRAVSPRSARQGAGELWLKVFRDYAGDHCILFPYRTAANLRGRVTFNFKIMEAHRAMCLMVHKLPVDPKAMALHRCGNGHLGCVTPGHLYWGDYSDNMRDAARHRQEGRHAA